MRHHKKVDLKTLSYHAPVVLVRYKFQAYLLYNSETCAYLYFDPHRSICFTDDHGNHFVCGPRFLKIKTDCEDITLELGQSVYVKSLGFHYCTLLYEEVYQKAVSYFTIFSE
jgi:hypothetical protein